MAAVATPMLALAAVQLRLGSQNIGPPACQFGRQTHWKFNWKSKVSQIKRRRRPLLRGLSNQGRQQMLRLAEALFERRQGRLGCGKLRPDCENVRIRDRSGFRLVLRNSELFFLETDDLFGGFDLRPIGSLGDEGVDDIAHKSEIGRSGGLPLILELCGKVFHRAALPAEYVHDIADRAGKCEEIENGAAQLASELGR